MMVKMIQNKTFRRNKSTLGDSSLANEKYRTHFYLHLKLQWHSENIFAQRWDSATSSHDWDLIVLPIINKHMGKYDLCSNCNNAVLHIYTLKSVSVFFVLFLSREFPLLVIQPLPWEFYSSMTSVLQQWNGETALTASMSPTSEQSNFDASNYMGHLHSHKTNCLHATGNLNVDYLFWQHNIEYIHISIVKAMCAICIHSAFVLQDHTNNSAG